MSFRVLIGCETSGEVRRAFEACGFDAWSCDLLPADDGGNKHLQADIRDVLHLGWNMLAVFHPPCTRLCNSGVRWLHEPPRGRTLADMWADLDAAAALFSDLLNCGIPHKAIENPVMHGHAKARIRNYRPPAQTIQPWQFGHGETKATCLWLERLPCLVASRIVQGREARVHRMSPGPDRWKARSATYPGVARAMARQWGRYLTLD